MNGFDDNAANGAGPHFQMDLLAVGRSGENGDNPVIRVSRRARRLSVRVFPDARVEVVVPPRVRPRDVERFIAAHREWIVEKREQALQQRPVAEAFPPAHIALGLTGERWRLHVAGGTGRLKLKELSVDVDGSQRVLQVSGSFTGASLRKALRLWLMRAARDRLEPRVAALARSMGTRYLQVSIRRQRSRWGSCSVRGTISLNVCLLFQRAPVVDYLVVHELTHVKHMNHSPRFWAAVESHCAGWRALDAELVGGWRHVPRWVFSDS